MNRRTGLTALLCAVVAAWAWSCTTGSGATLTVQIAPDTDLCDYTSYAFLDSQFPPEEVEGDNDQLKNNDQVLKNTMSSYLS